MLGLKLTIKILIRKFYENFKNYLDDNKIFNKNKILKSKGSYIVNYFKSLFSPYTNNLYFNLKAISFLHKASFLPEKRTLSIIAKRELPFTVDEQFIS